MVDQVIQARFDEFIMTHTDLITVRTAEQLARELGVGFFPEDFDL